MDIMSKSSFGHIMSRQKVPRVGSSEITVLVQGAVSNSGVGVVSTKDDLYLKEFVLLTEHGII